jgi:hypothetical protein
MSAPLNFPDVVFLDDLDPMGNEITSDLQGLKQDVLHILKQAVGSNEDDTSKGGGLDDALSAPIARLQTACADVDAQLADDDRIDGSTSTFTTASDGSYHIDVEIEVDGSVLNMGFSYSTTEGVIAL